LFLASSHKRKWIVKLKNLKNGEEREERFSFVVVATGMLKKQVLPELPGLYDKFKGEVIYSGTFNAGDDLKGWCEHFCFYKVPQFQSNFI